MGVAATFIVIVILLMTRTSPVMNENPKTTVGANLFLQCEWATRQIEEENLAIKVDNSTSRLHYTWLSQECEMQAGSKYIIRKYTFFKNGTFLLLRYNYVDEWCSIATYTVVIRGSIKLLKPSNVISGTTETKVHVDAVNIIPMIPQIVHEFGHKLNLTCGPQPKWRLYTPALIYERPQFNSPMSQWQGPNYNSLQAMNKQFNLNCLEPFGIEFGELQLLRVQNKVSLNDLLNKMPHVELFLANPFPNAHFRRNYIPTSLQSTPLVREDTITGCPICNSVSRGTLLVPPLLHQTATLPAMIGGFWHSERCESTPGGYWLRRKFQIYSGDGLWVGQWDYYDDPRCSQHLYGIIRLGNYVQRAEGQRDEVVNHHVFPNYYNNMTTKSIFKRSATDQDSFVHVGTGQSRDKNKARRQKRTMSDRVYQVLYDTQSSVLQKRFMAMLQGHQTREQTSMKPSFPWTPLFGTTKLDLYIAKNIPMEKKLFRGMPTRCTDWFNSPLTASSRENCARYIIEKPSVLELRAKLRIDWNGQYILLLGSRNETRWDPPLRRCGQFSTDSDPFLQLYFRKHFFDLFSSASISRISAWFLIWSQILLWCVYHLVR